MAPLTSTLPQATALIRLCEARLRQLFGVRAARIYGYGIALSFALLVLVAGQQPATQKDVLFRALATLSWIAAGMVGLSAARDLRARDAEDGIAALARQRGHGEPSLERARLIATAARVTRVVAVPGSIVGAAALFHARSLAAAPWNAYLLAVPVVYGALLGAGVGVLSRGAAALLPSHGRAVFVALVMVPELLRVSFADLPSVPAFYGSLLRWLADLGARLQ